jgi:hypothetical protein
LKQQVKLRLGESYIVQADASKVREEKLTGFKSGFNGRETPGLGREQTAVGIPQRARVAAWRCCSLLF